MVLLLILGPVLDKLIDVAVDKYYEPKEYTGPIYVCPDGADCKRKFLNCARFHELSDCDKWVEDKSACDGHCKKYHRKPLGGRGFGADALRTVDRSQFVPEIPNLTGKVFVGLKWDVNDDHFAGQGPNDPAVTGGIRAFNASGKWKHLLLSAGIYGLNANLIDIVPTELLSSTTVDFGDDAVRHSGVDKEGGPSGRSDSEKFGFNEVLTIDLQQIKEDIGSIVLFVTGYKRLIPLLLNAELSLFQYPENDKVNTLATVKLEPRDELALKKAYIFGKFTRMELGWRFSPIRNNYDNDLALSDTESLYQTRTRPFLIETSSASIPIKSNISELELRVVSVTKDRKAVIPIRNVGFVCYDIFGERMKPEIPPFECAYNPDGHVELTYTNTIRTLRTVFVYVDHGNDETIGDVCFVVGSQGHPVACGFGNLGSSKLLVARITDIWRPQLNVTTYAIPINEKYGLEDDAHVVVCSDLLVPQTKYVSGLRDAIAPPYSGHKYLVVEVLKGNDLAVKDLRTSDPYVVVKFGDTKFKTEVKKNTLNPEWQAVFKIAVDKPASDEHNPTTLTFKCKDWNRISEAKPMGIAQFNLKKLLEPQVTSQTHHLTLETDPKHPKASVSGSIDVRIYFAPN